MKRLDGKEKNKDDEKIMKRASLVIFLLVAVMFAAIVAISYAVEHFYGKTAGTISLVIMAAIIAVIMYRKEIRNLFRKKDD